VTDVLRITDFRMAGFLLSREVVFLRTEERGKQIVFLFDDTKGIATSILHQYPNSSEQRYDSACKTMHDLVRTVLNNKKN
tara:strand:- start:288 stop:527 length:240 start_codon:yes stop_codon:yes gene_type:complete